MDSTALSNEDIIDLTDILEQGKVPDAAPKPNAFADLLKSGESSSGSMSDLFAQQGKGSSLDEDLKMPAMDDVDAMLQDLQFPEQPEKKPAGQEKGSSSLIIDSGDDLDMMIDNIMAPENAPAPKAAPKAPKAPEAFESLDDLLNASLTPAGPAPAAVAAPSASATPASSDDELFDLDAALNAAMGETPPAKPAKPVAAKSEAEPSLSMLDDFDLDAALNAAMAEAPKPGGAKAAHAAVSVTPSAMDTLDLDAALGAALNDIPKVSSVKTAPTASDAGLPPDFDLELSALLGDSAPVSAKQPTAPAAEATPAAPEKASEKEADSDFDLEMSALLGSAGSSVKAAPAALARPDTPVSAEAPAEDLSFVEGRQELPKPALKDLERRLEKLNGTVQDKAEVTSMGLRAAETRISELEKTGETVAALGHKIEEESADVEERLALLEHGLTIGSRVTALEERLNGLAAIELRLNELGDAQNAGESVGTTVEKALAERIRPLDARLQDLEEQARAEQGNEIELLEKRVQDLETKLAQVTESQNAMPQKAFEERLLAMEAITSRFDQLEEKLGTANAENELLRQRLESLETAKRSDENIVEEKPAFSMEDMREDILSLVRGEVITQLMNEENVPPFADNFVRELVGLENRLVPLEENHAETPPVLQNLGAQIKALEDGLAPQGEIYARLLETLAAKADAAAAEAAARIIREEIAALLAEDEEENEDESQN